MLLLPQQIQPSEANAFEEEIESTDKSADNSGKRSPVDKGALSDCGKGAAPRAEERHLDNGRRS